MPDSYMFEPAFRADVWNATATTKLGVIPTIINLKRSRLLDQVGSVEFTFPAIDPAGALVAFGVRYRIYHSSGGFIGEYIHRDASTIAGSDQPITTVKADSTLKLLGIHSAKFNRTINNVAAGDAATAIINAANEADPYLGVPTNKWALQVYDPTNVLGYVTLDIQGQTILETIDNVRKLLRCHFRQIDTYTVEFGTFTSVSQSIYGANLYGSIKYLGNLNIASIPYGSNVEQIVPALEASGTVLITNCTINQTSDKVVNRVIVLGSGDGINQLTMQATYDSYATHIPSDSGSSYAVKRNANPDGFGGVFLIKVLTPGSGYVSQPAVTISGGGGTGATAHAVIATNMTISAIIIDSLGSGYTTQPSVVLSGGGASVQATAEAYVSTFYYYLEDTASINLYGVYEAILNQSNIRPLTNSDRQILYASDALYFAGVAYLTNNKAPQVVYTCEVLNFPTSVKEGDLFHFRYRGVASLMGSASRYIDVDVVCTILDLEEEWRDGVRNVRLVISTNGERETSEIDIVLGAAKTINALQTRVQPYPSREVISKEREIAPAFPVELPVYIEDDCLYLIQAEIQFITRPFRSLLNPDIGATLQSVSLPPTTSFTYYGDSEGFPKNTDTEVGLVSTRKYTDDYHNKTSTDPDFPLNRADHSHTIPFAQGINKDYDAPWPKFEMRGVSGEVTDQGPWIFLTWAGTGGGYDADFAMGGQGTRENLPLQYYTLGGRTDFPVASKHNTSTTNDTSHQHTYHLPHHYHTNPAIGEQPIKINFGIYDDLLAGGNFPSGITVYLDGALVGSGFPDGNGAIRSLNITSALQNAGSGLRATHTLRFECTGGRGLMDIQVRLYMALQATIKTVNFGG